MKRFLLTLTLVLACVTLTVSAAPKHRNHLGVNVTTADSTNTGITVYSDTTQVDTCAQNGWSMQFDDDDDDMEFLEPIKFLKPMFGVGGVMLALVVTLGVFLLLLAPIIIIIVLIHNVYKQRSERMKLAQKALENGQPIPDGLCKYTPETNEALWKRGIRNVSIGIGMILMFMFWESAVLMGVGALVACYGVGQLVIVRTSGGRENREEQELEEVEHTEQTEE